MKIWKLIVKMSLILLKTLVLPMEVHSVVMWALDVVVEVDVEADAEVEVEVEVGLEAGTTK
ncbi:hypothetical protein SLEP1_g21100 [Rubroshorea leprosula]|uniref:Uncharacterized protein n=1 Tax=Rubroshorea leprosula TaxID=152421 RepID=A0AAV5JE07_9ROSI|nr:hypothetical protein SLEP1_g21100 [Rubroshorea leprosula]